MTIYKIRFLDGPFRDEERVVSREMCRFGEYRMSLAPYRITPSMDPAADVELSRTYSYVGVYRIVSEKTYRSGWSGNDTVVMEAQFVGVDGPLPKKPDTRPITVEVEDFVVTVRRKA